MGRIFGQHQHLEAMVDTFDLATEPVDLFLSHPHHTLDYRGLVFGKPYRVRKDLRANRQGEVVKGETLHFLGHGYCEDHDGLRVILERGDGSKVALEFDGSQPEVPGLLRMLDRPLDYFKPVALDFSKRTKKLAAARAILLHYRREAML